MSYFRAPSTFNLECQRSEQNKVMWAFGKNSKFEFVLHLGPSKFWGAGSFACGSQSSLAPSLGVSLVLSISDLNDHSFTSEVSKGMNMMTQKTMPSAGP